MMRLTLRRVLETARHFCVFKMMSLVHYSLITEQLMGKHQTFVSLMDTEPLSLQGGLSTQREMVYNF